MNMKGGEKLNVLLLIMVLLNSLWLLLKSNWGTQYQENALSKLVFSTCLGSLVIIAPFLMQKLSPFPERVVLFFKQRRFNQERVAVFLFLILLTAFDLFFIFNVITEYDEPSLHLAAQMFSDQGWTYFFANYQELEWLGKQHPPLPVLCIGFLAPLFNDNIFLASRILTALLGLATAGLTFLIARKLYNQQTAFFAVLLLFGMRLFYLLNIISSNDMFVTFFFVLSVWLFLKLNTLTSKLNPQRICWAAMAGVFISLGLLSKYTMALVFLLLPALFLWPFPNRFPMVQPRPALKENLRSGGALLLIIFLFSLPLTAAWLGYLNQSGEIEKQIATISAYTGTDVEFDADSGNLKVANRGYFSEWRIKVAIEALFRRIPIAIGLYNLPLVALGIWCWIRDKKQKIHIWSNRLIAFWIAGVFIPVFLFLPIDRYFLPAFPALAIMTAHSLNTLEIKPIRVILLAVVFSLTSAAVFLH